MPYNVNPNCSPRRQPTREEYVEAAKAHNTVAFGLHRARTKEQGERIWFIKEQFRELADTVVEQTSGSAQQAIALVRLQEALGWALAAIYENE